MLVKAKELKGYKLSGIDGEIGNVKEFIFDDKFWAVRYLIANTGTLFTGKKIMISPYLMQSVDYEKEAINIDLTKEQIKDSPEFDEDKISAEDESNYSSYYGTPSYRSGPNMWGAQSSLIRDRNRWGNNLGEDSWNSTLRRTSVVDDHDIHANDGDIGHVDDFIIDDESWAIRYLIVDTKDWVPGKKVLISPEWIECISWDESKVFVNLTRDAIKQAPEYYEDLVISREFEDQLFRHYNREGYWYNQPVIQEYSH